MQNQYIVSLSLLALVNLSTPAWAAVTVTGISGASNSATDANPRVWGGLAGTNTCGVTGSTCNNCDANLVACNPRRIYDGLNLSVSVSASKSGTLVATAATADATFATKWTATANGTGTTGTISIPWSEICTKGVENGTNCEAITAESSSGAIRIWMDADTAGNLSGDEYVDISVILLKPPAATYDLFQPGVTPGIGGFTPYPGDEKIYFEDPQTEPAFPTIGQTSAVKIAVFGSENGLTQAKYPNGFLKDLTLDSAGELSDTVVDGLTNGTPYAFRIALRDAAENTMLWFPGNAYLTCDNDPPLTDGSCPYVATPDEVLGLLTEDINCFIATAAYGSALEPHIKTFREFRQKVLLPTEWGKRFNQLYYKYGPYAARFIHDQPAMRAVTRVLLWPAYGFTKVALRFGFFPAVAFTTLLITLLVWLPWMSLRRKSPRA